MSHTLSEHPLAHAAATATTDISVRRAALAEAQRVEDALDHLQRLSGGDPPAARRALHAADVLVETAYSRHTMLGGCSCGLVDWFMKAKGIIRGAGARLGFDAGEFGHVSWSPSRSSRAPGKRHSPGGQSESDEIRRRAS
jgi:hypothetical protein